MAFTKLDEGIVDSSLWALPHDVLRVWIYLLAKADRNGVINVAIPMISSHCFLPIFRVEEILDSLESEDPYSRTAQDQGRRIARTDEGIVLLNYKKYRQKRDEERRREQVRRNTRKWREKSKGSSKSEDHGDQCDPNAEAEADTEAETTKATTCAPGEEREVEPAVDEFDIFWTAYPKKRGKRDARKAWKQTARERPPVEQIVAKVAELQRSRGWTKDGGQFIPYPASWLRAGGWDDEVGAAGAIGREGARIQYEEEDPW